MRADIKYNFLGVDEKVHLGVHRRTDFMLFDIDNSGPVLLCGFCDPRNDEIEQIKRMSARFSLAKLNNIIFFLVKFANMSWSDAPFTTHLTQWKISEEAEQDVFSNETQGLGLRIVLIDTRTETIKAMRYVGLSNKFSRAFINMVKEQEQNKDNFNPVLHYSAVDSIYEKYSSKQLAHFASVTCKCGDS